MRIISRLGAVGAAAALAATTMFVGTAGAEDIEISAPLITPPSGLTINAAGGALELPAPAGSKFVGSFDDETGELTGEVTIAGGSFAAEADFPGVGQVDVEIFYDFESGGPIVDGEIDDDGDVSFRDVQTLRLAEISALSGAIHESLGDSCQFGPLELEYSGTYDEDTNIVTAEADFVVPLLATGSCGDIVGFDLATEIMQVIGPETLATSTLSFERAVVEMDEPEPEKPADETPEPTEKPAPTSGPAKPVAAKPSYTG